MYKKGVYGERHKISPGMGIEFTDISPDDSARISLFIKKLLAGDIMDEQQDRKEDIIKIVHKDAWKRLKERDLYSFEEQNNCNTDNWRWNEGYT